MIKLKDRVKEKELENENIRKDHILLLNEVTNPGTTVTDNGFVNVFTHIAHSQLTERTQDQL